MKNSILILTFIVLTNFVKSQNAQVVIANPTLVGQITNNNVFVDMSTFSHSDSVLSASYIAMVNSHTVYPIIPLAKINYLGNVFILQGTDGGLVNQLETSLSGVKKLRADSVLSALQTLIGSPVVSITAVMGAGYFTVNSITLPYAAVNAGSGGLLGREINDMTLVYNKQ